MIAHTNEQQRGYQTDYRHIWKFIHKRGDVLTSGDIEPPGFINHGVS